MSREPRPGGSCNFSFICLQHRLSDVVLDPANLNSTNITNFSSHLTSSGASSGAAGGGSIGDTLDSIGAGWELSSSSTPLPGVDDEKEGPLKWQYWDLLFLSEGVFALANIFSFMRLVTLATLSQHIGNY